MNESDDLTDEEIDVLNELIRRTVANEDTQNVGDALLDAYLRERVSVEEMATVRLALERSAERREEAVYLAGLYDPEVQKRFDETRVPSERMMKNVPAKKTGGRLTRQLRIEWPIRARGRGWWIASGCLAVLALMLLVVPHRVGPGNSWTETNRLTLDQVDEDQLRGESTFEPRSPREAAIIALGDAVSWDGQAFQVRAPGGKKITRQGARISFGSTGTFALPAGAENPQVWLLALPSLRLYHTDLTGTSEVLLPPKDPKADTRILTVTYSLGKSFQALPALEIVR